MFRSNADLDSQPFEEEDGRKKKRKTTPSANPPAVVLNCPVCNRSLGPFTTAGRNVHINACLDGKTEIPGGDCSNKENTKDPIKKCVFGVRSAGISSGIGCGDSNSNSNGGRQGKTPFLSITPLATKPMGRAATTTKHKKSIAVIDLSNPQPNPQPTTVTITAPPTKSKPRSRWDIVKQKPHPAPLYKRIPGTPFMVDAFQFKPFASDSVYVLTHYHSDHYGGLHKAWNHGPIYCSAITATLLRLQMRMDRHDELVRVLPMYRRVPLHGCYVTLVDANHCPGAVVVFIERGDTVWVHTGDFRHHRRLEESVRVRVPHVGEAMRKARRRVVYLDTTYGDPKYSFPEQGDSIRYCVRAVNAVLAEEARGERRVEKRTRAESATAAAGNNPLVTMLNGYETKKAKKTLFLVGTYFIGKEKILLALAKCCRLKVYAPSRKIRVYKEMNLLRLPDETDPIPLMRSKENYATSLRSFDIRRQPTIASFFSNHHDDHDNNAATNHTRDRFEDIFTADPNRARVHVMPLGDMSHRRIARHLDDPDSTLRAFCTAHGITDVVAFRPTGWAGNAPSSSTRVARGGTGVTVHDVPYSEHSTYGELCDALEWMAPTSIVPTVNTRDTGQIERYAGLVVREGPL